MAHHTVDNEPDFGGTDETFHVVGSGNLGLIYVRGEEERLTRRAVHDRFPGLADGMAALLTAPWRLGQLAH